MRRRPIRFAPSTSLLLSIAAALLLSVDPASASGGASGGPSFSERLRAQEAIERVYYAHQKDATLPFESVVTREVLRAKVERALQESAALDAYWHTPITAAALREEAARIARDTRAPDRLLELYAALGNDGLLIQECLVRPALASRLVRERFAQDASIHAESRRTIELLRSDLVRGAIDPKAARPDRTVVDRKVDPGESWAPAGEVGAIQETGTDFRIEVVLDSGARNHRSAVYRVPKVTWDSWWAQHAAGFNGSSLGTAPAAEAMMPAMPSAPPSANPPCLPDDTWTPYLPGGRSGHSAVWTGSVMVVWGGADDHGLLGNGGRYDPATDTWLPTSLIGAPTPRQGQVAVWTGNHMLVWGGFDGTNSLNTGFRYDPTTDTWSPMAQAQAPPARSGRGVWTGSRLLVWTEAQGTTNAGAAYDPVANTWTPISTVNAPSPRSSFAIAWTGQVLMVWGGVVAVTGYTNTGGLYDPATDTWTTTSLNQAPSARYGHTLLWTGSEVLVWGGYFNVGDPGLPARYDPGHDRWRSISTTGSPNPRSVQPAIWTGSRMIIWGGMTSDSASPVDYGGIYDPASDTWTMTQGVPFAPGKTYGHTLVWTGTQMLVFGGNQLSVYQGTPRRFDPVTNTWPAAPVIGPGVRTGMSVIWTGAHVIAWGGTLGAGFLNTGQRYDPALDAWTPISTVGAPAARYLHSAVWTGNQMLVWGGVGAPGLIVDGGRYDPVADSWTAMTTTNAPPGRQHHSTIWSGTEMIVWGGYNITTPACCMIYTGGRYDPAADTWTPTATPPIFARYDHAAAWTGSKMLIWGGEYWNLNAQGQRSYVILNDGGLYDPETDTWSVVSTSNAPPARSGHAAFWIGDKVLVWGGTNRNTGPALTLAGGLYDPALNSWQATSTATPLSPYATYTSISWTGNVLLVWGQPAYADVGTGARYDPVGNYWSPMSRASAPPLGGASVWIGDSLLVWGNRVHRYALSPDGDHDGVTACGGDCNDADPATKGMAAEVSGLSVDVGSPTNISWDSQSGTAGPATVYDLVTGTRTGMAAIDYSTAVCLDPGLPLPITSDTRDDPLPGQMFWYLARARNSCGGGTYGTPARDTAIPVCP